MRFIDPSILSTLPRDVPRSDRDRRARSTGASAVAGAPRGMRRRASGARARAHREVRRVHTDRSRGTRRSVQRSSRRPGL